MSIEFNQYIDGILPARSVGSLSAYSLADLFKTSRLGVSQLINIRTELAWAIKK